MPEDDKSQRLLGEMQSDIRHLQSDVTDIKADQRIRFDKIDDRIKSIEKDIGGLKESLASAKVWAVGLYVALAGGMLYVMARGFKWL